MLPAYSDQETGDPETRRPAHGSPLSDLLEGNILAVGEKHSTICIAAREEHGELPETWEEAQKGWMGIVDWKLGVLKGKWYDGVRYQAICQGP
jgi:hypothetical protein